VNKIKTIVEFIRIHQWYKNVIIFLPLVFSLSFLETDKVVISCIGFISLCLISSGMYVRNDITDLQKDKLHPFKKFRALASGIYSTNQAWMIFLIFITTGLVIGISIDLEFFFILILLITNSEVYSRWTKKIIFLDAFAIGGNFIIRAISGVVLIDSPFSPWLILGVFFVALLLVFLKRKNDMQIMNKVKKESILTLREYSIPVLNSTVYISAAMVIVFYSLYTINGPNDDWRLILTTPIVIYVIYRQIHLSNFTNKIIRINDVINDKSTVIAFLFYTILTIFLVYFAPNEWFSVMKS